MPLLDNYRWVVQPHQFAAVLRLPDAPGFFSKQLVLEPGIEAAIVDDGVYVGDLRPGTHTLQTFSERLQFWKKKQATAILTREEDQRLTIRFANVPTAENVLVQAEVLLSVCIDDTLKFLTNLLGPRDEYSLDDLTQTVEPILRQALWNAVGRSSLADLTGPECASHIDAALDDALKLSLGHYGLGFSQVHLVTLSQPQYDAQRRKTGEIWLRREGLSQTAALQALQADEEQQRLKGLERENELKLLAEHLGVDMEEGEHAVTVERMALRRKIRESDLLDEFHAQDTDEKRREYLSGLDRKGLLRDDEVDALVQTCRAKKEDREAARRAVTARINLEQQADVARLRAELEHSQRLATKDFELELAQRSRTTENEEWSRRVETERRESEHRYRQETARWEHDSALRAKQLTAARGDEMETVLQMQKVARVKGDVELEDAQRKSRLDVISSESKLATRRAEAKLDLELAEAKRQLDHSESTSQLERLAAVQKMNFEFEERRQTLKERQQRTDAELEERRLAQQNKFQLERMTLIAGMDRGGQIATAGVENAALLAEVSKHEMTTKAASDESRHRVEIAEATARAEATAAAKRTEAEERRGQEMAELFKQNQAALAAAFQQGLQAVTQVASSHSHAPQVVAFPGQFGAPAYPAPVPSGWAAPAPVAAMSCPNAACRAPVEVGSRHCKSCGTRLA